MGINTLLDGFEHEAVSARAEADATAHRAELLSFGPALPRGYAVTLGRNGVAKVRPVDDGIVAGVASWLIWFRA